MKTLKDAKIGDTVKVVDGPLEGFLGTVEEVDSGKQRVRVIVSMFGRKRPSIWNNTKSNMFQNN